MYVPTLMSERKINVLVKNSNRWIIEKMGPYNALLSGVVIDNIIDKVVYVRIMHQIYVEKEKTSRPRPALLEL